jgi:hypothetical protein
VHENDAQRDLKPSIKVKSTKPTLIVYSENGDTRGLSGTTETDTIISPKSKFSNRDLKDVPKFAVKPLMS